MRPQRPGRGLHNVPAELTSFVGRRRELAQIKQKLAESRLVTLTGPGGVGKTRLALRVASEVGRAFPDGVWFVRLASIDDAQLLTQAVYDALDVQNRSSAWSLSALADHLAGRHLLIILDNCEHLIDSCAVLADTLLESCPRLRVLATSRQALGIEGEIRMRVPSLSLPEDGTSVQTERLLAYDAMALLAARAAAVQPRFTIEQSNATEALRLCRRLDGIPLALELAAARLEGLGLNELNTALDSELPILGAGNRRREARQRTLDATISWSYRLLNEHERRLWARLSVFAGSFVYDAAVQVCSGPELPAEAVLPLLATLVEKSILKMDPHQEPARYVMLQTLRAYGRQRLREFGEELEIQARHRDWILALASAAAAWDQHQAAMFNRIYLERDNVWAALDFCQRQPREAEPGIEICRALYVYWHVRGPLADARRVLSSLAGLSAADSLHRADALWVQASLAVVQNDFAAANRMLEESLRIGQLIGNREVVCQSELYLGVVAFATGRSEEASDRVESALELARQTDNAPIVLSALNMQASIELSRGELDRVIDRAEEALALSTEAGELWVRGMLLNSLSQARWQRGDTQLAETLSREGVATKHALHDQIGLAILVESLAMMAVERGAPDRAASLLGCAERMRASAVASLFEPFRKQHERSESMAREQLGMVRFANAADRGKAMSTDEAVAYALGQERQAKPAPPRADAAGESAIALTRREDEIATLVADGLSNKQIAAKLVVSERTAEYHILNILNKLGFNSRSQIASWAQTHQVVATPAER